MRLPLPAAPLASPPSLATAAFPFIVAVPALVAQEPPETWSVDPMPAVEVGVVEGLDAEMFVRVHDAALLPGGGVVVLDAGAHELRYFDASGDLLTVAGRDGEGPGEFVGPFGVEVLGDSVVAWDYRRRTLSFWTTGGELIEERRVAHHPTFHEGELWPDLSLAIPDYGEGGSREPPSGRYRAPAVLLRYADGEVQELGPFSYDEMLAGDRSGAPMPHRSRSAAAAGGSPLRIFVADDTNEPRVRRYDGARLVDTLELLDTREEVTPEAWEAMTDTVTSRPDERARARTFAAWGRPDLTPAFEDLRVDSEGRLWVLSRTLSGEPFAVVYDDGRPVARVPLPEVERIFEITADRILALTRGPFDVEVVAAFRYEAR